MKLYCEGKNYKLYQGSMLDLGEVIKPNSIGAVITDPPYELNFMNKGWDNSGIAFQSDTWRKCFEVLKPGGYLLAFGGSRTFHRIAVAIEDAGFEIRDVIMWLYGSGFPKSMNIGKGVEAKLTTGSANTQEFKNLKGTKEASGDWGLNKNALDYGARPSDYSADGHLRTVDVDYTTEEGRKWDGWGTALKPSYEPIIVARKPCEDSCISNVLKYGVGGLNIDECRIGDEVIKGATMSKMESKANGINVYNFSKHGAERLERPDSVGRFPANTILTYDNNDFEEVCGGMPEDAERYLYCAKASQKDRDEGLDEFDIISTGELQGGRKEGSAGSIMQNANGGTRVNPYAGTGTPKRNNHPTVKPTELMQYLVRLVTPDGETVLDTFNGTGSTGKAVMFENIENNKDYKYIGIELTPEYLPIAKARIEWPLNRPDVQEMTYDDGSRQMNIFDYIKKEG